MKEPERRVGGRQALSPLIMGLWRLLVLTLITVRDELGSSRRSYLSLGS